MGIKRGFIWDKGRDRELSSRTNRRYSSPLRRSNSQKRSDREAKAKARLAQVKRFAILRKAPKLKTLYALARSMP